MKHSIGLLCILATAALLSSCSCAIRSETWVPVAKAFNLSAVEQSALAIGFRRDGDLLIKRDSYLRIQEDGHRMTLQSSWCPLPSHLIRAKSRCGHGSTDPTPSAKNS